MEFFGFIAIKNELMMSEPEITVLIQLTNNKIDLRSPVKKHDTMAGTTDNARRGKLIKTQNLGLDRIVFVWSQKNMPLNVKLISPFLIMTMM
jgi:hypothetical protein